MRFIKGVSNTVLGSLGVAMSLHAVANEAWLIVPQTESVNIGQKLSLQVIKPQAAGSWPAILHLKLSGPTASEVIEVTLEDTAESSYPGRVYSGAPGQDFVGLVRAELVDQSSNRVLLLSSNDDDTGPVLAVKESPDATPSSNVAAPQVLIAKPEDEPAISPNESTYFLVGSSHDQGADARFQISFKYRPFEPQGSVAQFAPFLSNLYFAYTQTTLWDIGGDSSPFRDTSYRPSLFYRWAGESRGIFPDEWRVGVEHESNGQGGVDSRSLNIAYVRPSWYLDLANGKRLTLFPKIYGYIEKDDNPDIQKYRGYVDWQVRYGRDDGLMINGLYRQGNAGYATGQIDVSYPLSDRILSRMGTFAHLQLFSGYGETLLDYNRDRDTQIRLGISISR
ncbi:phospholipase A [Methylobacillus gramineus]|uniref:phospholipase A n=1 Tax=Methylobacillus gramineus TaxID=755169 RepID=UPI001CFFAE33|nr:phospholipase A [Methylobacillus gramineus]MCB5184302.1 phospholipase A [Methylobacillus gramineus]